MSNAVSDSFSNFDTAVPAHADAWLALGAERRRNILAATPDRARMPKYSTSGAIVGPLPGLIQVVALEWAKNGRAADAQTLFDDLVELSDLPKEIYCNALWVVQNDNSKIGVQPERARRYLDACLPHGPSNPAIFYNAACVLLELGDRDGALANIAEAKAHDYDGVERMRDDKFFLSLRGDPRFEEIFADMDPPEWDDLEVALSAPEHVRNLSQRGLDELPETILRFPNLEVLDICFSKITAAPEWLTKLTKLRKLELNWNAKLKTLPDEILAMPSLREISFYESGLGKKYMQAQVNALLNGFAKSNPSHETRMLHIALLLQKEKEASARGGLRELVEALDSNVAQVRAFAMRLLAKKLGDVAIPLREGGDLVVLGKLLVDRDVLAERLARRGMSLARTVTDKTVAVIIGEQPKGKATVAVDRGMLIALEEHLRKVLDDVDPGHLIAADAKKTGTGTGTGTNESAEKLGELLMSTDSATVSLAIDMMKRGGVPSGVLEELFLVMQNTSLEKKPREGAKKLFQQYAPTHVQDAVKSIFARTSIYLSGETKVRSRLKQLGKKSKGALDPVKLALLLLPSRRGFSYLFEVAKTDGALAARALEALRVGDALDLSQSELDVLPDALGKLEGLTKLDLAGCHLTSLPDVILSMTSLVELDLSRNRLDAIPDSIERLANLRKLSISANFIRQFPEAVFRLTKLESLAVSTARYDPMREIPFTSIPPGLGALTSLQSLDLGAHHLQTLPEDLRTLKQLRSLDLASGKLGEVPSWLVELPTLAEVDLRWTELKESTSADTIAKLRARGVTVKT